MTQGFVPKLIRYLTEDISPFIPKSMEEGALRGIDRHGDPLSTEDHVNYVRIYEDLMRKSGKKMPRLAYASGIAGAFFGGLVIRVAGSLFLHSIVPENYTVREEILGHLCILVSAPSGGAGWNQMCRDIGYSLADSLRKYEARKGRRQST